MKVRKNIVTVLLMGAIYLSVVEMFPTTGSVIQAQTLMLDNFESHALGAGIVGLTPNVGANWGVYAGTSLTAVENTTVYTGNQAVSVTRDAVNGGGMAALTSAFMQENTVITWSMDWYRSGTDQWGIFGSAGGATNGSPTGVYVNGSTYHYRQSTGGSTGFWANTGVAAPIGSWAKLEMELTVGAVTGSTYDATYDIFVTPDGGVRTLIQGNIAANFINAGAGPIRGLIGPAAVGTTYYDNVMITEGVPAVCGDATHPIPAGDINLDCRVDMLDFASMSMNWLACTDIVCL